MNCPSCTKQVPSGAWICPYCDYILDASVLDAKSSGASVRPVWTETTGEAPEAMILGDVNIDPEDFQVLPGAGAQGDGRTATFLFYTSGATSRVLRPDVVPVVLIEDRSGVPITPYEDFLLSSIDGRRTVREIQRTSGLQPQEVTITLLTLLDKKIIRITAQPHEDEALPVAKPRPNSKKHKRKKSAPRMPSEPKATQPLPTVTPTPIAAEDAEAVTEWSSIERLKIPSLSEPSVLPEIVARGPSVPPPPPRDSEPPPSLGRARSVPPPLPRPTPAPVVEPVLPEVYAGKRPVSEVEEESFDDDSEDTQGILIGIPKAMTPGLAALPTLPPPQPIYAEDEPGTGPADDPSDEAPVVPQDPTPLPELGSGEFDDAPPSERRQREELPRLPTAIMSSAAAAEQRSAPPRLPSAFILERSPSPPPPAPTRPVERTPPPAKAPERSDTPLLELKPEPPPSPPPPVARAIEEKRAEPRRPEPPKAEAPKPEPLPPPAPAPKKEERRVRPDAKPVDGFQMAKAQKLFSEALKDKAEGNIVSARMNMKLALTFDPANELYHEAYQELLKAAPIGTATAAVSRARELYDKATHAEKLGRFDDAIDLLEQAIVESKDPAFYNRLGVLLAMKKNEFERAQSLIETALGMSPGNATYEHNLSKVLQRAAAHSMKGQPKKDKKEGILGFLGRKK
ncbi:MAG: hypothetical protein U1E65_23695 [Myxococcota bacterium]